MVNAMQTIENIDLKLTELQEKVLLELMVTTNMPFICKKLNIKPISLTRALKSLETKNLVLESKVTSEGKKMAHYILFRNETISLFLAKHQISETPLITKSLRDLNYLVIIALRNSL